MEEKEAMKFYELLKGLPYFENGKNKFLSIKKDKEAYDLLELSLPIVNCTRYFKWLQDHNYIKNYMPSSVLDSRFEQSEIIFSLY